jgi:predicted dehydrogenase
MTLAGVGDAQTEPVRIAVVGLGYWGPNLVRNLQELPQATLSTVCDVRADALARITKRYPAVATTESFADILRDPDVEAVCIATPPASHHRLAVAALQAGKHVFVEKPLADSAARAAELVTLADELGLTLMPGHTFLYSPPVNVIRDLIRSGELGEIYFISTSRVNLGLHQPDASVVWDLAPHDLSILLYWLEEVPQRVSATSRACIYPDTPDVAFLSFSFGSGTIANVELSWLAPSKLRRTTVIGSQKMVIYDDTSNEPVRVFDSGVDLRAPETFGEYQLSYRTGDIVSPRVEVAEPLLAELADFCRAVRTGAAPRSSAQLGLQIVEVIEAVERSLASGHSVEVLGAALQL